MAQSLDDILGGYKPQAPQESSGQSQSGGSIDDILSGYTQPDKPQDSFMDKAFQVGTGLLGLPGRAIAGVEGLSSEVSKDPKKVIKDYYQGMRGQIQNDLLPEIQKQLGPLANAFAVPQSITDQKGMPSTGLSGSPQIPTFKVDDPNSYAGAAGKLTSQIIPGEKVASATESIAKPLLESFSKSLDGKAASKVAKALTPLVTKAAGGAVSAPIYGTDAQTGAIANTLFGIPHAISTGARNIASKALLPGAINSKLADLANNASELENNHGAQIALDEYKKYVGEYKDGELDPKNPGLTNQAWDSTKQSAVDIDPNGKVFQTSEHSKNILASKNKLLDKYKNSPEAVKAVNDIMNDQLKKTQGISTITGIKPQLNTLSDAINERQSNNASYQNVKNVGVDSNKSEKAARDSYNAIRSSLAKVTEKSIADNAGIPGMSEFSSKYAQANKMTQDVKNNFESTPSANEKKTNTTKFINALQSKHPSADISRFYEDMMPSKGNTGTAKFDQLKFMLGNDDAAKENAKKIITSNLFKDSVDGNDINPSKMYNKYKSLSQTQKDYLFDHEDQHTLNLLKHSKNMKSTNLSGIGRAAMIPIHIINLLTSAYGGYEGNELGATFGHRLLSSEIAKRMGKPLKKGIIGKTVPAIGRGLMMTNTQQDQQGAQ